MIIKAGKMHRDRIGATVGPLARAKPGVNNPRFTWSIQGYEHLGGIWTDDGEFWPGREHERDLVEVTDDVPPAKTGLANALMTATEALSDHIAKKPC